MRLAERTSGGPSGAGAYGWVVRNRISTRRSAGTALGVVSVAITYLLVAVGAPAAAERGPVVDPSRLAHVGDAGQVIVVTAPSWHSVKGTLSAYERDGAGGWREVVPATPAWLGYGGLVPGDRRKQGTGTTPAGTFAITSAFGRLPDPGTKLPYRQFDTNDSWTYDPDHPLTYNVFQTAPIDWRDYGGYAEHLWLKGPQYRYVAVLDYNLPTAPISAGPDGIRRTTRPPDTRRGGGIFLHVEKGRTTAGCVSIPVERMRQVLSWLKPGRNPVIVIGPESEITRM
jgi:L,D-peptidoglycan transpeptidase YkuD (ErfK/YbiS/YcfS/YnhG family)